MEICAVMQKRLFDMQDEEYRAFHMKLIPNVEPKRIIGVRTPKLRALAKEMAKNGEGLEFIKKLPHKYYEENNLHAFILETIKDYGVLITETEKFLPFIDNWATCDGFLPKVFSKNKDKLIVSVFEWLNSKRTYTVRFAIGVLMKLYLDEDFKAEYMRAVSEIDSEEYYIKMMQAWYFQTALVKQYESAIEYIKNRVLPVWVHNKAIQKAVESFRISPEQKEYLKSLKIARQASE